MTLHTESQYRALLARFAAFGPHPGSPEAKARAFLQTLTLPMGRLAHQALKWAHPEWAWPTIPKPRPKRNEAVLQRTLLGAAERAALRASLTDPRDRALCELFWTLRRAEAARASWRDVDLGQGMVYVVGKGGKPSWTLLPESAQAALAEWYIAAGQPPDDRPIFPGLGGRPMSAGTVSNRVRKLLRRAGLYVPGRGAHSFRRTAASAYLKENPEDIRGLQALLRHASIATTALYCFLTPEDIRPRFDRVRL